LDTKIPAKNQTLEHGSFPYLITSFRSYLL
jgi:hypothetical protein